MFMDAIWVFNMGVAGTETMPRAAMAVPGLLLVPAALIVASEGPGAALSSGVGGPQAPGIVNDFGTAQREANRPVFRPHLEGVYDG